MVKKSSLLVLLLAVCLALSGCGGSSKGEESEPDIPSYQVYLDVDFEGNLLFDKYDVDVCFDEEKLDTIPHGTYYTKMLESVEEGSHTLLFHKNGDESVKGDYEVKVKSDTTFKCKIHAKGSEVKIDGVQTSDSIEGNAIQMPDTVGMNLEEAKESLTEQGFVNVTSEAKDDVIFVDSNWTVVSQNIEAGTECDKNSEIILTCEHNSEEKPAAEDDTEEAKADIAVGDAADEIKADTAKEATVEEVKADTAKEATVEEVKADTAKEAAAEDAKAEMAADTADEAKTEEVNNSIYDLAYKTENNEYAVYYLIDTDDSQVCTFSTNDTSILKGSYTGDLDDKIDVAYDEENHELIKNKEKGSDEAVLISPASDAGFEYANEFRKTTVEEAEEALNKLTGNSGSEEAAVKKASAEEEKDSEIEKEESEKEEKTEEEAKESEKEEKTEEESKEAEIPSMTASDLKIGWQTDYGHASTDIVILGNDEGAIVKIEAPERGVTTDDLFYVYDDQIVNVGERESTDYKGNPSVELQITGLAEGKTDILVVVEEEYEKLGENATVISIPVKKLDSAEGRVVYYTPNGEKYHFSADCAGENARATTLHDAASLEMEPCGKCAQ